MRTTKRKSPRNVSPRIVSQLGVLARISQLVAFKSASLISCDIHIGAFCLAIGLARVAFLALRQEVVSPSSLP